MALIPLKPLSLIKTENKLLPLIQALKIKTLSKELQDYKVKSIKGLQDYICLREGLQDYKRRRITKVFLRERESYLGPRTGLGNLNLETWDLNSGP